MVMGMSSRPIHFHPPIIASPNIYTASAKAGKAGEPGWNFARDAMNGKRHMTKSTAIWPYKITTSCFMYWQSLPNHQYRSHFSCKHFEEMVKAPSWVGKFAILYFIIRRPYHVFTSSIEQLASPLPSFSMFSISTKAFRWCSELLVTLATICPADFQLTFVDHG